MKQLVNDGRSVEPERPNTRAIVPFVVVSLLGLVSATLPPFAGRWGDVLLAAAVLLVCLVIQWEAIRPLPVRLL